MEGMGGDGETHGKVAGIIMEGPNISYVGEPIAQAKLMVSGPSGNLIEIKAYRHPEKVLGEIAR